VRRLDFHDLDDTHRHNGGSDGYGGSQTVLFRPVVTGRSDRSMRLLAFLPPSRFEAGTLHATEGDQVVFGPVRAWGGTADNVGSGGDSSPREAPTKLYGDHPTGLYRITGVEDIAGVGPETYGSGLIALEPLEGEALAAKQAGRTELGIVSGRPHADGRLRKSHDCLRIDEASMAALLPMVRAQFVAGKMVLYECRLIRAPL
jgi:hypothetical protein